MVRKIAVGGEGGWDYLTVDKAAPRLYVTHATRVVVLDADSGASVGEIPDTAGVHGVALASDLGRGFTSNGRASTITIFDLKTLKPLSEVKTTARKTLCIFSSRAIVRERGCVATVTAEQPRPRPPIVPGSFAVLIVGK